MIGIYKITSPTKKVYIGQSINIEKRFNLYLKLKCKGQIKLYNSFKKYGVENHKFEVLCECEIQELNDKERYYQDLYSAIGKNGLNCKLTKSNDRICKVSEETKIKISIANKKVNEEKRKISGKVKVERKKPSVKRKKIYFPLTNEFFESATLLYETYKNNFHSYSSLIYNIKNKKVLHKFQANGKNN